MSDDTSEANKCPDDPSTEQEEVQLTDKAGNRMRYERWKKEVGL